MTKEMQITLRDARQRDLDAAAVLEAHGDVIPAAVFHAARLKQSAADFEFLLAGQFPVSPLDPFAGQLLTAHQLMPDVVEKLQFMESLLERLFTDPQALRTANHFQHQGSPPPPAPDADYPPGDEPLPRDVMIDQLRREQAHAGQNGGQY